MKMTLPISGQTVEIKQPEIENCQVFDSKGPALCKCKSTEFLPIEFVLQDSDFLRELSGLLKCKKCGSTLKLLTDDTLVLKLHWPDGQTSTEVI